MSAEEERYARHEALKARLYPEGAPVWLTERDIVAEKLVHHITCAVFNQGCQSYISWEQSGALDWERLLELNGWRLDHGKWVCGLHEIKPVAVDDLRTSIQIQVGAVVEYFPHRPAANRDVEKAATDSIMGIISKWLKKQSSQTLHYRASAELLRISEGLK